MGRLRHREARKCLLAALVCAPCSGSASPLGGHVGAHLSTPAPDLHGTAGRHLGPGLLLPLSLLLQDQLQFLMEQLPLSLWRTGMDAGGQRIQGKRTGFEGEVMVVSKGKRDPTPAVLSPLPGHRHPLLTGAQAGVPHSRLWGSRPSSGVLLPAKERQGHEAPGRPRRGREGHVAPASAHLRVTSSSLGLLGPGL